jgi:hypothetical protein
MRQSAKRRTGWLWWLAVLPSLAGGHEIDYAATLTAIAQDLDALGATYPALVDFAPATHLDVAALTITYAHRTGPPQGRGGWTAGVPHPQPDGVWLRIDIHAADSTAQVHTQPMTAPLCLGARRVSFLILEGERIRPVAGAIDAILRRHGVGACPAD